MTRIGSVFARSARVVFARGILGVVAAGLAGCFVPAQDPRPNIDAPPTILNSSFPGSTTTPDDSVFLVTQIPNQIPNGKTSVRIDLDVVDEDSNPLYARAFVIGPAPSSVFDAGITDGAVPSAFVKRYFDETAFILRDGRGQADFTIPNDRFTETGRCYLVEVRVSSRFAVEANVVASPDERDQPEKAEDLAVRRYWVASYGPSTTSVDLSTCPVQP